jgi:alkylated DNA repair protein (DNA oxidative demethylase)
MTAFGPLGWTSDKAGYRYVERHPDTDRSWPDMPPILLDLWKTGWATRKPRRTRA